MNIAMTQADGYVNVPIRLRHSKKKLTLRLFELRLDKDPAMAFSEEPKATVFCQA